MEALKIDISNTVMLDSKDKIVVIAAPGLTEQDMSEVAKRLKKAGATEVIFNESGVEIDLLSDEDLASIGLCRIKNKGVTRNARKASH